MAEKNKSFDLAAKLKEVSTLDIGIEGREQIKYIHIDYIHPDERNFYELSGVEELAANIEMVGLQQPLRVRADNVRKNWYIIVSGHRRFAALQSLAREGKENYDRFAYVPCIVEQPSVGAADEVDAMLQELRLIYGNSDTRRMSSADISRQAERVETLLYQLKEAGMEFPGKMRDHVAEACKVSASKLARLKVIRENLDGEMKEQWEAGDLNESEAYNLAKLPLEHRAVVWAHKGDHAWNYAGAHAVETYGERLKRVDSSAIPDAIPDSCPVGYCANLEQRRKASLNDSIYWDSRCEQCCHGCPNIGTCKYACPSLASEIDEAKQAAKKEKARKKAEDEERDRPEVEALTKLWRRFGMARKVSGICLDELAQQGNIYPSPTERDYLPKEQGKIKASDQTPFGFSITLSNVRTLLKVADALGVSLDYLFCRTDDPREAKELKREVREWRSRGETPPEGKPIITYGLTNDGPKYTPAVWDGRRFHAPGNPDKELTGLGQRFTKWTLLPEDE